MGQIKLKPLHKVGAIIGALKSGQIDAWAIVPHIAKALARSGKVHIIGWINDYAPDYQVTTVFTSASVSRRTRCTRLAPHVCAQSSNLNETLSLVR